MKVERLLYATDIVEPQTSVIKAIHKLRVKELVLVGDVSLSGLKTAFSSNGIKLKVTETQISASSIVDIAKRETVSLILAHFKTKKGMFVKRLINETNKPIIFIPPVQKDESWFNHILFATNWSSASEQALLYLLSFKELIKELDIVYVISKRLTIRDLRELKNRLAETRKLCLKHEIDAEFHIYAGKVDEEIIKSAQDYHATAIVMGSSRKSLFREILLGSCSTKVVKQADIPVLIIPERKGVSHGGHIINTCNR